MIEGKPKVDVIIPTHAGRENYLLALLESLARQTFQDFRVLIADNDMNRTTAPPFIQQDWGFPIVYRINNCDLGPIENMKYLLAVAEAEYIKPMMSDDLLTPDAMNLLVRALDETPSASMVFGRRNFIDTAGNARGEANFHGYEQYRSGIVASTKILSDTIQAMDWFPGEPSNMLARNHLVEPQEAFISYTADQDEAYQGSFDLIWYLRLLEQGDAYYVNEAVSHIREHDARALNNVRVGVYCRIDYYYLSADSRFLELIDDNLWSKSVQTIVGDISGLLLDDAIDHHPKALEILAYADQAMRHLRQHRYNKTPDQAGDFFEMFYALLWELFHERVLAHLETGEKNIALYGAGNFARRIMSGNRGYLNSISVVLSSNADDSGKELRGRSVYAVSDIDLLQFDYILIASTFVKEISETLVQKGMKRVRDFFPLHYPRI